LEENPVIENLVVAESTQGTYNTHPADVVTYTLSTAGVAHGGTIWLMKTTDKTVSVLYQQADEDSKENKAGFDLIESTFTIK
jgi:hypothetical protein